MQFVSAAGTFLSVLAFCFFQTATAALNVTKITETYASFAAVPLELFIPPVARMPSRSLSGYGTSNNPDERKVRPNAPSLVCGPAIGSNSFSCFDARSGAPIGVFPLPGRVTTVPTFYEDTWFVGTSEGFFIRLGADASHRPLLGNDNIGFWGNNARVAMSALRPVLSGANGSSAAPKETVKSPQSWKWHHAGSAEFIGTPLVAGSVVYVLSANQFLHAFDLKTGRLLWAARLGTDVALRMTSVTLATTPHEVLVGTNDGSITALSPKDGKLMWKVVVPSKPDDRFNAVVAPLTVVDRSVIVSNADSTTVRVSLDAQTTEWSFPVGSVAQVKVDDRRAFIGGNDGAVTSVDSHSGKLLWKVIVTPESPIASLAVLNAGRNLLVASKNGTISVLSAERGKVIDTLARLGEVAGEFFPGLGEAEVCLSFVAPGFRCFTTALEERY